MTAIAHLESQKSCPFLPEVKEPLKAVSMKRFGKERGNEFYFGALEVAQSLWLQGLPAQALLQINRAFGAELEDRDAVLYRCELPYRAVHWIMSSRKTGQFIGNPRRHFQHLATRMVEPRKELRSWRAWACWYLARQVFPDYPADEIQLQEESVCEPEEGAIFACLEKMGLSGEAELWKQAVTHPFPGD